MLMQEKGEVTRDGIDGTAPEKGKRVTIVTIFVAMNEWRFFYDERLLYSLLSTPTEVLATSS